MRKRVVRTITYEGDERWVDATLSKSMSDGTHHVVANTNTIKVRTESVKLLENGDGTKRPEGEHL